MSKTSPPKPYRAKTLPFSGTRYADVAHQARLLFKTVSRRSKRQPYIRSAYFHKDKIFFTHFWTHLSQNSHRQRTLRLKYLPCGLDLIRHSHQTPISKENVDRHGEILHRFHGITEDGQIYFVQVKETKRTNRKELMSVFPKK